MIKMIQADGPHLGDVQAIESELIRLWRELGTSERPAIRARVLTLIAVTTRQHEAVMVEQLMGLAERHPARNILILLDEERDEEHFEADVTLLCRMGSQSLCAEQVRLHAARGAYGRLPGAARALLSVNLPTVLWWALPMTLMPPLYGELAALADHIVVDSATLCDQQGRPDLPPEWFGPRSRDLNWSRLTPWREIIAQFFDAPAYRSYLWQLNRIEIQTGSCPVAGWLLAGWLASRLEWKLQRGGEDELHYRSRDGGEVQLHLSPTGEAHALCAVTLHAGEALFNARRMDAGHVHCSAELPGENSLQQIVHLSDESETALLSRELDLLRRDRSYEAALAAVLEAVGRSS